MSRGGLGADPDVDRRQVGVGPAPVRSIGSTSMMGVVTGTVVEVETGFAFGAGVDTGTGSGTGSDAGGVGRAVGTARVRITTDLGAPVYAAAATPPFMWTLGSTSLQPVQTCSLGPVSSVRVRNPHKGKGCFHPSPVPTFRVAPRSLAQPPPFLI